jgi:tRNA G10  N-methylase Trm11
MKQGNMMIDHSEAFKAELKSLMDKYNVMMDFIEERAKVNFYTDFGRGKAVTLRFDREGEVYENVADCIE